MYLVDISYGSNLSYSWDFGDGNTSTQSNPMHTYAQTGTYYICLSITSTDSLQNISCSDIYCSSVLVDSSLLRSGGYTIQIVRETDLLTNTKELIPETSFSLYPNPFSNSLVIELPDSDPYVLNLYDIMGNMLSTETVSGNKVNLERGNLNSGIYFIELRSATRTYNEKVLVD